MPTKIKVSKNIPPSMYPHAIERDYLRDILTIFQEWFDEFIKDIGKNIIKLDAIVPPNLFNTFRNKWARIINIFEKKINVTGRKVMDYNFKVWEKQVRAGIAVNIFQDDKFLNDSLEIFTKENVRLIKNVGDAAADKVQTLVTAAVHTGENPVILAAQIKATLSVSENRAALIAIDQIGKFNGQVTKTRQTELGLTKYIWQTVQDERVRPSHVALNQKSFSWKEPPAEGHPGYPIRCRCTAFPDFDSIEELKI